MSCSKIIIEPSNNAHWYELIKAAHDKSGYCFDDDIENYLMLTLQKFLRNNRLADETIALRMLESFSTAKDNDPDFLRDIGDECLIISGLFPARAIKRNVSLEYYIHSGQSAYQHFASNKDTSCTNPMLFQNLSKHFVGLLDILHLTRTTELWTTAQNPDHSTEP
jgi:hypothetical protein